MQDSTTSSKKKVLVLASIALLMLVGILLILLSFSMISSSFSLEETAPVKGSRVAPQDAYVTFVFNEPLPLKQGEGFSIDVSPDVDFLYGIEENTLTITLSNILLENTVYSVSINNLYSKSGAVIPITTSAFEVVLSDQAHAFLDSLPYKSTGFSINQISEYGILVLARQRPAEDRYDEAFVLLRENGLDPSLYQVGTDYIFSDYAPD